MSPHPTASSPPILVRWGLAEKPDNSRMRRWFRITQAGLERYAQVEYDREHEPDDELQAQYQDALRRFRLSPENWRYTLALIQVEARVAYRVLARDMAAEGYLFVAEPGHTPDRFLVWFYGLHNGRVSLLRIPQPPRRLRLAGEVLAEVCQPTTARR